MEIIKISSDTLTYEVGEENVSGIYLTDHGNEKTAIYKIIDAKGELIVHAGLLEPHEVVINTEDSEGMKLSFF